MEKQSWNKFILENNGSFLQSWEWGEFQHAFGRRVFRLAGDNWQAQFIEMTVPIINKKYWYGPRAPLLGTQNSELKIQNLGKFIDKVKEAAKKEGAIFFRIGPSWQAVNDDDFKKAGFKKLHYDIEPSQTLILDLDKSDDELLAQMHEKTRYNIRLAERKGVKIIITSSQDDNFEKYFEDFYRLVDQGTSERKNINHHEKEYYKKQLQINGDLKIKLFIAEYENKVIAANMVAIFGQTATYLYGATDNEFRSAMAPHLLQWEQIKFAKSAGCARCDFWGIINEHTLDKRGASWAGFTRFKKGFGGREKNYIGYLDYPMNKAWYSIYQLAQKFRR